MYPVSSAFLTQVRKSHQRRTRVLLRDPDGTGLLTLYPERDGYVTVDSRRDVRRSCDDLRLAPLLDGVDLIPSAPTDPLSPLLDNEVAIFAGVKLDDGTWEEVPIGVFGFQTITMQETRSGITLDVEDLADRSRLVTRAGWVAPYTISPGQDLALAVQLALRACWPRCPDLQVLATTTVAALAVFTEGAGDPWKDLCGLVAAYGMELFFDATGLPVLRNLPTPSSTSPTVSYTDGADAVLTSIKRSLTIADSSYNGVIVTGESTSGAAPVRAARWDTAGSSLLSPNRPKPLFYSSSQIVTQTQADLTADAMLPRVLGATESLSWSQVSNPAHDAWDLCRVQRSTVKADTYVLLDMVKIPLTAAQPMQAVGRSRQVWA